MDWSINLPAVAESDATRALVDALLNPDGAHALATAFQAEGGKEAAGGKGFTFPQSAVAQGDKTVRRMPMSAMAQGGKPSRARMPTAAMAQGTKGPV